jgi:hypothetical protein
VSQKYKRTPEDWLGYGLGDHNFCRNPGWTSIFCFTFDEEKQYEECKPLSFPPITSKFADIKETWLPAQSIFKFSDNKFGEFEQAAVKEADVCLEDCIHKYQLKA